MTEPIKNTFAEGTPKKATAWRESMGNLPGRQEVAVGLCVLMMIMPDESQTELFHFKDAHTSSSGSPEVTLPRVGAQVNCTRELAVLSSSEWVEQNLLLPRTDLAGTFFQAISTCFGSRSAMQAQ